MHHARLFRHVFAAILMTALGLAALFIASDGAEAQAQGDTPAIESYSAFRAVSGNYFVGWRFTVQEQTRVAELGAFDANGNGQLDNDGETTVGLYEGMNELALVNVPRSAPVEGGFAYAQLRAPVTLQPGIVYTVASEVRSGAGSEPLAFQGKIITAPGIDFVEAAYKGGAAAGAPTRSANLVGYIGGSFRAISGAPAPTATAVPPTATEVPVVVPPPGPGRLEIPGAVQAEDYAADFLDTDAGNSGNATAAFDDDVDVWNTVGEGGFTVGRIRPTEYTTYQITAEKTAKYRFVIRTASGSPVGGNVTLSIDGNAFSPKSIVSTGNWWAFRNDVLGDANLSAGNHTLKVEWGAGQVNFDRLDVSIVPIAEDPVLAIPGRVEAESFAADFSDSDAGNNGSAAEQYPADVDVWNTVGEEGFTVGRIRPNEYTTYEIDATESGSYAFSIRTASGNDVGGEVTLSIDGNAFSPTQIAPTGGWWDFTTTNLGRANISAGRHTVRVQWGAGQVNFDRLDVSLAGAATPTAVPNTPVPSTPVPVQPTPTVDVPESPGDCAGLTQEAENGLLSGNMIVRGDASASGGAYVVAPNGGPQRNGDDYIDFCIVPPTSGVFKMDARVSAPNSAGDSFFVTVLDGPRVVWDIPIDDAWTVDAVSARVAGDDPVRFGLAANGRYKVRVWQREDGARIDNFSFVKVGGQATYGVVDPTATAVPSTPVPATPVPSTPVPATPVPSTPTPNTPTPVPATPEPNAPTPTPIPDAPCINFNSFQEAENGVLVGTMGIESASNAGNGQFVRTTEIANGGSIGQPGPSWAEFCVTVPSAGQYVVEGRTSAVAPGDDSFWVSVGDQQPVEWFIPESTPQSAWSWNEVNDRNAAQIFNLSAGDHIIRFSLRETGTALDRMRVLTYVPPTPTPLPTATPTPAPLRDATCRGLSATHEFEQAPFAGEFEMQQDSGARGGEYIVVPNGSGGSISAPSPDSFAKFCVTVPQDGRYAFEVRARPGSAGDDSVWFQVDNDDPIAFGIPQTVNWTFQRVSGLSDFTTIPFELTAGEHQIKVSLREDGTELDSFKMVALYAQCSTERAIEAEDGALNGTFDIQQDAGASGGDFVVADLGETTFPNPNYVEFCFTTSAGRYRIDARTKATFNDGQVRNSFYVTVDNGDAIAWPGPEDQDNWLTSSVRAAGDNFANEFTLPSGDHVVRFYLRESGFLLDRLSLVRTDLIRPGDDVKAIVEAAAPGSSFLFAEGVYNDTLILPKDGMSFSAENPWSGTLNEAGSAIFDGQGAASVLFAGQASDVTIEGFEIRNYLPGEYQAPISARVTDRGAANEFEDGENWIVRNNFIHDNDGAGINLGSGMVIEGNQIFRNAQIGISGIAEEGFPLTGVKIRNNTINGNTSANPTFPFEFHEGGIKATYAVDMEVTGNTIRDNRGAGMYCDLFCENLLVDDNQFRRNGGRLNAGGVFFEIGDGAVITNNVIDGISGFTEASPLWGGVTIAESQNVRVENNTINLDGGAGIMFRNRTDINDNAGNIGRDPLANIVFNNNTVTAESGETRVGFNGGTDLEAGAVTLTNNTYIESGGTIRYTYNGARDFAYWQNTLGFDNP